MNTQDGSTPQKKRLTIGKVLLILGGVFLGLMLLWLFLNMGRSVRPGVPLFPPNEAANFVVEPLDENGDVDYYKFVNLRGSEGVTPENNAMVKFVQALGPKPFGVDMPAEYFERLGIEPPPVDGQYFADFQSWFKEQSLNGGKPAGGISPETAYQLELFLQSQPWTPKAIPLDATQFVADNEAPIKLVLEGLQRPKFYSPKVSEAKVARLITVAIPHVQSLRSLGRHFATRSNLRWGEGNQRQAIVEALNIVRLGGLQRNSSTMLELLIAVAIRKTGIGQLARLVNDKNTTVEDLQFLKTELAKTKPVPSLKVALNLGERSAGLDTIQSFFRAEKVDTDPTGFGINLQGLSAVLRFVDPESTMVQLNENYEELIAIFDAEFPVSQQLAELNALEQDISMDANNIFSAGNLFWGAFSRTKRGELLGKALAAMMLPATSQVYNAILDEKMQMELLKITIEIELFHRKNGSYPTSLDDLVPAQLSAVPSDFFSETPLNYSVDGGKFLLFSSGPNGFAERSANDPSDQRVGDDIILPTPPNETWKEFKESAR